VLLFAGTSRGDVFEGRDCTVEHPPSARRAAERIAEGFAPAREQAALWLGVEPRDPRARILLVEDHAAMRVEAPGAPSWAVAVTRADGTMVYRLDLVDRTPGNSLDLVLKHETVHFVLRRAGVHLPRWFEEGLCVHHAGLAYLEPDTTLERLAAGGSLPSFAGADRLFVRDAGRAGVGYSLGRRVLATFVRRFGDDAVRRLVSAVGTAPFPDAFAAATGEGLDVFERRWRDEITPGMPLWLFLIVENFDLALLCGAALLVALGYLRWRLKRASAMAALGGGDET
jgi:hypothetical protein